MQQVLGRYAPQFFALLRIVSGLMFALHGSQKLLGWPGTDGPVDAPLMKVAGAIELIGGLLIAIGFLTGIAAFIASGEMAAAYFMAHASDLQPADPEQRRAVRAVLLPLPVHRRAWGGDLECGRRATAAVIKAVGRSQ